MEHDASGTFETTDILVSAEVPGKIESLEITEGDQLEKGQYIGYIDTTQLFLKKLQLEASSRSVTVRKPNVSLQVAATKDQITKANVEKARIQRLLRDGAATQKQLDDIDSQLDVLKSTLSAQMNSLTTSVQGLDKESSVYQIQVAQIEDQLRRSRILSPIDGVILVKYTEPGEMAQTGKALFKIADMRHLFLKAYLVSDQLAEIKIGQKVTVFINGKDGGQKSYPGTITWIADEAEFTPKTIQTKDERQNLVYAVKIAVENKDGAIKIGMYGDVDFSNKKN
jgi:HlyD family secretion protein